MPGSTLVRMGAVSGGRACGAATVVRAREAGELARDGRTRWLRATIRYSERGLSADFALFRVRVAADGRQTTAAGEAEWLVIRKLSERRRHYRYTLINAPAEARPESVIEPLRAALLRRTHVPGREERVGVG